LNLIEETSEGPALRVHVTPRARVSAVTGADTRGLLVRVRSAPEKGKANDDVERTIARWLGVPPSTVTVVSGQTSRAKRVRIDIGSERLRALVAARLS
jgi:uncharacterized protein (TIGR00251 family)